MKPLKEYIKEKMGLDINESDAPTNTTGGVANPDASPFKKTKFAGFPCVEVDGNTYIKCTQGKRPYARWKKYVEEAELEGFVKKNFHKEKRLLIKNRDTGAMSFIK